MFCWLVFRDEKTEIPVDNSHELEPDAARPDCVYMDAMGFGMGCCCLQLTFQACCIVRRARCTTSSRHSVLSWYRKTLPLHISKLIPLSWIVISPFLCKSSALGHDVVGSIINMRNMRDEFHNI